MFKPDVARVIDNVTLSQEVPVYQEVNSCFAVNSTLVLLNSIFGNIHIKNNHAKRKQKSGLTDGPSSQVSLQD